MIGNITQLISRFRIAARELYNQHLQQYDCRGNFDLSAGFNDVERMLFRLMVSNQTDVELEEYGTPQTALHVVLREQCISAPAMVNRDINSGYWDYPIDVIDKDATLQFVSFFDWDDLDQRDNSYVTAVIAEWPAVPETKGKYVLIEWRYVAFALR